ncbi:MAG TPA: ATP-binding protein [Kofleriaceae bacterium]|nr:ATP-binding protein [Kofleriaceae bacterium]
MGPVTRPRFVIERRDGLRDVWTVYEQMLARGHESSIEAAFRSGTEAPELPARAVAQLAEHGRRSAELLREAVLRGDWPPYIEQVRELGARYADLGVAFTTWHAIGRVFMHRLVPALVEAYASTPLRLTEALSAAVELIEFSSELVAERYFQAQEHAAVEQRTHQLELSNRELEAFSYSVVHDLRAPLRVMSGFSQLLLDEHAPRMEPEATGYLHKIQHGAARMAALIDALLGLSRVSRSELQLKTVDLTGLARSVITQLAVAEPHRAVDVTIDHGLSARGDARLLRTLLENLLGNAWKFTSKAVSPWIAFGSPDRVTFVVRDNGAGFDLARAGKLFTPFERMHSADEFPGSGIGLATVQRIVHRHGGRIWVESKPGKGAAFFFTLAPGEP